MEDLCDGFAVIAEIGMVGSCGGEFDTSLEHSGTIFLSARDCGLMPARDQRPADLGEIAGEMNAVAHS